MKLVEQIAINEEMAMKDAKEITNKIVKAIEEKIPKIYKKGPSSATKLEVEHIFPGDRRLKIDIRLFPGSGSGSGEFGSISFGKKMIKTPNEAQVRIKLSGLKRSENREKKRLKNTIFHEVVHAIDISKFKGYKEDLWKHRLAIERKGTPYALDNLEFNAIFYELKKHLKKKKNLEQWNGLNNVRRLIAKMRSVSEKDIPTDRGTLKKVFRRLSREGMVPKGFTGAKGGKLHSTENYSMVEIEDIIKGFK